MRVQYLKHPDTPHWSHDPMVRLGEDDWGIWLGATPETWYRNDPDKAFAAPRPMVQLIVPGAWWTYLHNDRGTHPWYVDIVTPPTIEDTTITMVDLDLDVIRNADGTVYVDDEDEFAEHRVTLGYPERWIDQARVTAARIALRLEGPGEPFGSVTEHWLGVARNHWPR